MSEREPISGTSQDYGSTSTVPAVGFADFSPTELYNLSESIAENVNIINGGLRSLEKMNKQIGGPNDSVQLRDKIHETQQRVNGSVSGTARDLRRLRVLARRGARPQRLQLERLTQAFSDALASYSAVQKQVSEKMAAHMPRARPARAPAPPALDDAALGANHQAQARLVEFETSMLLEREAYINKIEADVLDVNQIMQDLAEMVNTQAQAVDTVESHISSAAAGVEAGTDELAKAAEHQRRYRRKMFILILIGVIIAIIFVVWIVRTFR
ncbi:syntaxin-12 isoform X2 [Plodia interpunctella]|nr:syntaxin-12 isoform X2 [Plodia interpunctella]XP_053615978.1 syntaxin-12 isoform X2 [Plodia interpunctella]XP_053615979.1 syntaxin-12 isoform X2 [Plodia interpunctella]XP_053615980.1 syntaxin-12 isoform X2 [Plodia interpunctella]